MDSFTFKGINSSNIEGIVVNSLPPITKAAKRTSKTQIDGKDGDIIEFLGYEAYDKEVEITILQDTDIDTLINWLNGSGKLILSNESDKYYEAEIIEQIDFSRIVKYEPIAIKFHVQPYKYSVSEQTTILEITTETSLEVTNSGFIESKPIITLYGSGIIELLINNSSIFTINIDDDSVTIDAIKEDAYKESILKNRQMNGDFENIRLQSGVNTISWVGELNKIEVEAKSRWL